MVASTIAPRAAPYTLPEPPQMLTPPMTTAASTCISIPKASSELMLPTCAPSSSPTKPAIAPAPTYAPTRIPFSLSP